MFVENRVPNNYAAVIRNTVYKCMFRPSSADSKVGYPGYRYCEQ